MKNVFKSPKTYIVAGLVIAVIVGSAWRLESKAQSHDSTKAKHYADADTTKPRKHDYDKDDNGIDSIDQSMRQLDRDLGELNVNIDLSGLDTAINDAVREAMSNVNVNEIVHDAMDAVKDIDWDAINNQITESLNQAQVELRKIDANQIRLDIKNATDEINSDEIRQALDSAKIQETIHDALKNLNISINGRRVI